MDKKDFDKLPEQIVEVTPEAKADAVFTDPRPASLYLPEYYQSLGDGSRKYFGIETGIKSLDDATLGLDGLIVLGGIAGRGKTSFALQLAVDICDKGTPTLFYSLEMPKRMILTRILSRRAKVSFSDILLKGKPYLAPSEEYNDVAFFNKTEIESLKAGQEFLETLGGKFYIRSRERGEEKINFDTVKNEIDFIKAQHGSEKVLVLVDHLQVFDAGDRYKDQLDKENKLITGFKGITEETGATIILISQKNKAGFTSRGGLQTIKGSVDIVYLADVVMFLEADDEKPKKGEEQTGYERLTAKWNTSGTFTPIQLVIDKNRYQPPKTLDFDFDGEHSNFIERNA